MKMIRSIHSQRKRERGFTIVELMIATMVFSTILVAITVGVMYFTRSYYKSVYESATQNAARNSTEAITKAIQFSVSGGTISQGQEEVSGKKFVCAGGYIFVYKDNIAYKSSDSTTVGLYMQPLEGNCTSVPSSTGNRRQLLGENMRVSSLAVNKPTGTSSYNVTVTIAYGDNDLLLGSGENVACISGSGSEYCAVATVRASAVPRVAN